MAVSWIQIVIVVALLILLFGRGRISALMGDLAKGIKSFRQGMQEDEKRGARKPAPIADKADKTAKTDKSAAADKNLSRKPQERSRRKRRA